MAYEQTILSQISQLRDVLQRYHGFAVIRELIQNADDARATRLDIGCLDPLPDADHPLLKGGPSLFVLNDGPFTPENARSIKQLGLSDKAGDAGTIGKFGLGLKSIHHFGEIYFYLSSANFAGSPLSSQYHPDGIQNPWHDPRDQEDPLYPEWNEFSAADRQRICDRLRHLLADGPWFCLVVPLRRREHVGADSDAIAPQFPGDAAAPASAIFAADFEAEVARLLPLLRHLRSVRRWSDAADGTLREASRIGLDGEHQRSRAAEPAYGLPLPLHGVIEIGRGEAVGGTHLTFAGQESYQNHPGFARIASREDWPRPLTMPRPGQPRGRSISQPEPSIPHAAACFARLLTPGEPGRFVVTWASYLPVKSPSEPVAGLQSPDLVTLTLHGRFFVDAGREGIDFGNPAAPPGTRNVRQEWNDLLRDDGTLDLIIPALEEFALRLAPGEPSGLIRELTGALRRSPLFRDFRGQICRQYQWVYLVGRDGAGWTRVSGNAKLYALPEPIAADPPLAEVFPRLPLLGNEEIRLSYTSWPCLRKSDGLLPWPENVLLSLLRTDQAASFADPARMGLVVRTLRGALPSPPQSDVVKRLLEVAREGLLAVGGGEAARRQRMIEPFLDLIPACRKLAVDLRETPGEVAGAILAALWASGREPLVVPFGVGDARPRDDERVALVECLLGLDPVGPSGAFLEARADLACQVVRSGGSDRDVAWAGLDDRAIFPTTGGDDGGTTLRTRSALATALRGSRLFVDRLGLAGALHDALADGAEAGSIVTISRRLADAVFGAGVVPDADARSCLVALATRPALAERIEPRKVLIERLLTSLGAAEVAAHRVAFRYLLHGDPARCDDPAGLLFEAGSAASPAWIDLARRALRQDDGDWRAVPRDLAELFTSPQRTALGVAAFDRPGVVGLLRQHGPGRLDLADLADDDIRTLIAEAAPADFDVIRGLPIHRGVAGSRVAIDESCYWQGDFPVQADLAEGVTILAPHANQVVASKQREIHPPTLDARGVIALFLKHPEPRRFGPTVLVALARIGQIPANHSGALRTTRWVETADGRAVAPAQVVRLSFGDEAVRDALGAVEREANDVVSILELAEPYSKPGVITRLFPESGDALERLGRCLGRDPGYRIGNLTREEARLDAFRVLFRDAPADVMPCSRLLGDDLRRAATRENIDANLAERLIPQLIGPIPSDRLATILKFLASSHRAAPAGEKDRYLGAYRLYIEAATRAGQVPEILRDIPLLDGTGAWSTADRLAMGAANIHPASLLDGRLAAILAHHADRHDRSRPGPAIAPAPGTTMPPTLAEEADRSVVLARDYFEQWAAAPGVNRELIGGLLALLGDGPAVTELAGQFLGNFDRAELRNQLDWRSDAAYRDKDGTIRGGAGRNLADLMRARRVIVDLGDGDRVAVTNLLGEPIVVSLNADYDDLLLPHAQLGPREGHEYLRLRLRRVAPRHLPGHLDPATVLRRTARRLLEVVDHQRIGNFDEVWDRLARSEQLDLDVAQRTILDGLVHLLLTLELRHKHPLANALKRWHDANRASAQVKDGDAKRRDEAERRKQAELVEVRRLVEQDVEAQGHCLAAVRDKLKRYEYDLDSIPFELFQNADDASVELGELLGPGHAPDPASRRFVVAAAGTTLWFASWGRAINRHQFAGFDGAKLGFDQDLEKMLTLNWSDKGRDLKTTGKFGLGFKSVLLASDRPRVVSDRLAFEVAGGLLPARMPADRARALRDRLKEHEHDGLDGTIVELPLTRTTVEAVLDRFRELAPLLPIFARRVRACSVPMSDGRVASLRWEPTQLGGDARLEVGSMSAIGRLLVLRGETSALALLVTRDGIGKLPDRFPTAWVTAPTRHDATLGFAVNAPFALDVGRSQLAQNPEENNEVADRAGVELGAALVALFRHADADWPGFRQALDLRADLTPVEFWESAWNLLARPLIAAAGPLGSLLRRIFWDAPAHGMRRLISETAALPTLLPEPDRGLTRLDRVRGAATGLLMRAGIYPEVARWSQMQAAFPAGSLVSDAVSNGLVQLKAAEQGRMAAISIGPLLDRELGSSSQVSADLADRLGRLVILPSWESWRLGASASKDRDRLLDRLERLHFRSRGRGWRPAAELLVSDAADDEGLQARFAPAEAVLHADYAGAGVDFFRACRSGSGATEPPLAAWAIAATGNARAAVLAYLDRGLKGRDLAAALPVGRHWIAGLDEQTVRVCGLDHHQAGVVLGRLKFRGEPAQPRTDPPPRMGGRSELERIDEWWAENGPRETRRHDGKWYPGGEPPDLADHIGARSSIDDRKGWMTLLMLGAMHTMGRAKPGAHRTFVEFCESRRWLDTFSGPPTDSDAWMNVLIQYHDGNQIESRYLHWMGRFASIFQFAYWLPTYVGSFLAIEQEAGHFELADFLDLRISSRMQRSGLDAPPASRTLGIGACFVVRELCRTKHGYARHESVHHHCYVPTARVRRLMKELGCGGLEGAKTIAERVRCSSLIYDHIKRQIGGKKATFGGAFDLPLIALTERGNAEKVLGPRFRGLFDGKKDDRGEAS